MPIFRPQRQFGQWLLRALGAQDLRTGRTISQLDWDSQVNPTYDVGLGANFPGLTGIPQREVWLAAGQINAFAAANADLRLWAAPTTFTQLDPRTASGIWILSWEARIVAGGAFSNDNVRMGVTAGEFADPGAGLAAGDVSINAIGGTPFVAGTTPSSDLANNRSPRCQVNMRVTGAFDASLVRYPLRSATVAPLAVGSSAPAIYVPPGRMFEITSTTANEDVTFAVWYVEAEEPPILAPFPT